MIFDNTYFKIAAIETKLPAYKLAIILNELFSFNFEMNLDWESIHENENLKHHHYFDYFEDVEMKWHLIQNKSFNSEKYIFKTKPLFDFFLLSEGKDYYQYFERALKAFSQSSSLKINAFDISNIKNKNCFIPNNLINSNLYLKYSLNDH